MKKIAVLFHGHLRSYSDTSPYFKKNVVGQLEENNLSVDTFLHTWDIEEFSSKTWHEGAKVFKPTCNKKIESHYSPKLYKVENQKLENTSRVIFTRPYSAIKSVWYSFNEAFNLMRQNEIALNFKYDIVIVTRPDVLHYNPVNVKEVLDSSKFWQCSVYCNGAAGDVFFYSSRDNIEKSICTFYDQFDKLHAVENLKNTTWQEFTFNEHVKNCVEVKKSKYCMPRDWRIQRSWWDIDHKENHRKWDKDLCEQEIKVNEEYKYFR